MKLALFDLDSTLLPMDSDHGWGEFAQQLGWVDRTLFKQKNDAFYQQYLEQQLDMEAYIQFATQSIREQGMQRALEAREAFMEVVIKPVMHQAAVELVRHHLNQGAECIMITATNAFVTEPIAKAFGFEHLIATDLVYAADGTPTGEIAGIPSFHSGKVTRLMAWLKERQIEWEDVKESFFYSDSINDLPLLEIVSKPIATNPDPQLRKIAEERGWEILSLFE